MKKRIITYVIFIILAISFYYTKKPSNHKASEAIDDSVKVVEEVSDVDETSKTSDFTITKEITFSEEINKIQKDDIVFGDPNSKVVFIVYSAPSCTHCAYYHKRVFPLIKKAYIDTNKIAYVMREFIGNKQDLDGAILNRCYKEGGVKVLEALYEKQDNWAFNKNYRDILGDIGKLFGISQEDYTKCLADDALVDMLINKSRIIANNKNFIGTPGFVINGTLHNGKFDFDTLSNLIKNSEALKNT
jgi:protein-disulfide isomerase